MKSQHNLINIKISKIFKQTQRINVISALFTITGEKLANFPDPHIACVQFVCVGHELGTQAQVAADNFKFYVGLVQVGGQQIDI